MNSLLILAECFTGLVFFCVGNSAISEILWIIGLMDYSSTIPIKARFKELDKIQFDGKSLSKVQYTQIVIGSLIFSMLASIFMFSRVFKDLNKTQ